MLCKPASAKLLLFFLGYRLVLVAVYVHAVAQVLRKVSGLCQASCPLRRSATANTFSGGLQVVGQSPEAPLRD